MIVVVLILGMVVGIPMAGLIGRVLGPLILGSLVPPVVDQHGLRWEGRMLGPQLAGTLGAAGFWAAAIVLALGLLFLAISIGFAPEAFLAGLSISTAGVIIASISAIPLILTRRKWKIEADAFEVRLTAPNGDCQTLALAETDVTRGRTGLIFAALTQTVHVPARGASSDDQWEAFEWLSEAALKARKPPPPQAEPPEALRRISLTVGAHRPD